MEFQVHFQIAVIDGCALSLEDTRRQVDEVVGTVQYMVGRTLICVFFSIAECNQRLDQMRLESRPHFNLALVNTDTVTDYVYPLKRLGPFTSAIKLSKTPDLNTLFSKQPQMDYMVFPLDHQLLHRALRNCCAVNRLSPEYIPPTIISPKLKAATAAPTKRAKKLQGTISLKSKAAPKRAAAAKCLSLARADLSLTTRQTVSVSIRQEEELVKQEVFADDTGIIMGLGGLGSCSTYFSEVGVAEDASRSAGAVELPKALLEAGKLLVINLHDTSDFKVFRANSAADSALMINGCKDFPLDEIFGCATSQSAATSIRDAIRSGVSLQRFVNLYPRGRARSPSPIAVLLSVVPITKTRNLVSKRNVAILSFREAGAVGYAKMLAGPYFSGEC